MADQRRGGIGWCTHTVNPIRARLNGKIGHHCVKVSDGCTNCYASKLQPRFGLPPFEVGKRAGVEPFFDEKPLREVLRRKAPSRFFWCDMSDLFGEWVSDDWIDRCFAVMALTPQHTYQVLTKRPERMRDYMAEPGRAGAVAAETGSGVNGDRDWPFIRPDDLGARWPLPSVWLGVSVEDQRRAEERIPILLNTPAAVHFLSVEPLLAPVDLRSWLPRRCGCTEQYKGRDCPACHGTGHIRFAGEVLLSWVIVGGESGPHRRPMELRWLTDIVEQCQAAGVPCYCKQDSAHRPGQQGRIPDGVWAVKEFPDEPSRA